MPNVTMRFKLPEEQEEFELAYNGGRYRVSLQELDNRLRGMSKYELKDSISVVDVRAMIAEIMEANGVALYE